MVTLHQAPLPSELSNQIRVFSYSRAPDLGLVQMRAIPPDPRTFCTDASRPERMGCVELNAEPVLRESRAVVLLSTEARPCQPEGTADLNAGSQAVGVQPGCSKQDAEKEGPQNRVLKDHIQQERQGLPRALR